MKQISKLFFVFSLLLTCLTATAQDKYFAFPGAEGFGRYATGGRGGVVRHVTNLNDSGTGSLRAALNGTAKKIIVFDVSGTIHLTSQLNIPSNTTIAGQSAPGDGICIADCPCIIKGNNIIVRYMRFRLGNKNVNLDLAGDGRYDGWDGFGALDCNNIIIDHCSVSWSIDECLSMSGCKDITVQWCLVGQSMVKGHSKLSHGYGGNWGGAGSTYHHNLLAHHNSRAPRLGPRPTTQLDERMDMRNNVIYNWGNGEGCYGGEAMKVNIVNNYYKPGPATISRYAGKDKIKRIAAVGIRTTEYVTNNPAYKDAWHIWGKYYVTGNMNTYSSDVFTDNWTYGMYNQIDASGNDGTYTSVTKDTIKIDEPIPYIAVTTHSAEKAYEKVLQYAGASLKRDAFDLQMVNDTRDGKATSTGSGNDQGIINTQDDNTALISTYGSAWPTLNSTAAPTDTDQDGIPDAWEDAHGLNKSDATDGAKYAEGTGYTNVEVYLNSLVEDITNAQNEGGIMLGETLPGESVPVAYTIANSTYQSEGSTNDVWNFADGVSITGAGAAYAGSEDYNVSGIGTIVNNVTYTIHFPEGISIGSITITGYCNTSSGTSKLAELNGKDVSGGGYTFPNRSTGAKTYNIALETVAKNTLTFKLSGGNRNRLAIVLNGVKEGTGVVPPTPDDPGTGGGEQGETVEYTISPDTHEDDWKFGDVSITSSKSYSEGHVTSDFTGIKFSRNTDYTVTLPEGVSVTSVEVKGYTNIDEGDGDLAYISKIGDNTYESNSGTFPFRTENTTDTHTYALSTPAKGTMVLCFGGSQATAIVKLIGTTGTTGIKAVNVNDNVDLNFYNLQGIRVVNPKKGIYIQNGKKVVIK